jgi:hypothetical protein
MNYKGKGIKDLGDIIGIKFGNLTPIKYLYSSDIVDKKKDHYYECTCTCGNNIIIKRRNLRKLEVLSCGCLRRQRYKEWVEEEKLNGEYYRNLNYIYTHNKSNAKLRELSFSIDKDIHSKLILDNCHYCGNPPSNKYKPKHIHKDMLYNGLDRKDSNKGYEIDNIVTCCIICNRAKMDMSYEDFIDYIKKLSLFNRK